MKPTSVVAYLVEQMKEEGLIRYDKELLSYLEVPKDILTPKQLSGYIKRDGEIRNRQFLKQIESRLGLTKETWSTNDQRQIALIDQALHEELSRQAVSDKSELDISKFIPTEMTMTQEQSQKLEIFIKERDKCRLETLIDSYLRLDLLKKRLPNQQFITELIKHSYDKGLYLIIVEFLLPKLYAHYRGLIEIQRIEAHTRGSLGEYDEAKHILHLLIHHNTIENINLRTSALSNHKRQMLGHQNNIDSESVCNLVQGYQELHAINGYYSYYTGINLLYMVVLGQILFPDKSCFNEVDTDEIYKLSKPSLQTDKTHASYYVTMSDLEFRLLLGYGGIYERVESFLANESPQMPLVERTIRQMRLFIGTIEQHIKQHHVTMRFERVVQVLEGYCEFGNQTLN